MNKLAYDLALLCAEHGLRQADPETNSESAQFALQTFKQAYDEIVHSGEPLLDSFGTPE